VAGGDNIVPIVCGASLYDLTIGDNKAYPDADSGRAACDSAGSSMSVGNIGAGTGATVGKLLGNALSMKAGCGAASTQLGAVVVTSLVAVNALGNVYDRKTGAWLAGVRDPQNPAAILGPYESFLTMMAVAQPSGAPSTNTTIGCVLTNGSITKAQAAHIADMAHDGYARAIEPVHTGFDGDAIFVLSTATVPTSPDLLGALGALTMEAAIHNAVHSVSSAFGLPAARDLTA
jgi:L-aminopeptidase/D-esterase-like protein